MVNLVTNSFSLNSIEGVIFDKDGTITDSNIYWSEIIKLRAQKIIEYYGLKPIHFKNICSSMGLDNSSNRLLESGPIAIKSRKEVINSIVDYSKDIEVNFNYEEIEALFFEVHNKFLPQMDAFIKPIYPCLDLIKRLYHSKVKLSLLTSDTTKNAELVCKKLKITSYFEHIVGGDLSKHNKSSGMSAKLICKKMNIENKNVICIGDTPIDHEMAINANLKGSILVESGQIPLSSLLSFSKHCVNNLSEIFID